MDRTPLFLNGRQAAEFVGVSYQTFRHWSREPEFTPRPVSRSGSTRKYWRAAELEKIGMSDKS